MILEASVEQHVFANKLPQLFRRVGVVRCRHAPLRRAAYYQVQVIDPERRGLVEVADCATHRLHSPQL